MVKRVKEVKFYDNEVTVIVTIDEKGRSTFKAPEGYVMYPMDLDGISNPAEYGYDRDLIKTWKVGVTKRIAYMIPVRDKMYNPLIAPDKAEDKRDERKNKCMVPGIKGGLVMCREASCLKAYMEGRCKCCDTYNNITRGDAYLEDLMKDSYYEPSVGDVTSTTAIEHIYYDDLLAMLAKEQRKLADICRLKGAGYTINEISKFLNINENTIGNDIRRIKELSNKYKYNKR